MRRMGTDGSTARGRQDEERETNTRTAMRLQKNPCFGPRSDAWKYHQCSSYESMGFSPQTWLVHKSRDLGIGLAPNR